MNGYLIAPSDFAGWRAAMGVLAPDEQSIRLGYGALATWNRRFAPTVATRELEEAYGDAVYTAHQTPR